MGPSISVRPTCGTLVAKLVNEITTLAIAKVLTPVWRTKPEVARKPYPAIRRVFDRARVILRDQHGIELTVATPPTGAT